MDDNSSHLIHPYVPSRAQIFPNDQSSRSTPSSACGLSSQPSFGISDNNDTFELPSLPPSPALAPHYDKLLEKK